MFLCIFHHFFTVNHHFMCDHVIDRIVNPVKMSCCPLAFNRIAVSFLQNADFIFCRQCHRTHRKPLPAQNWKGFFGNGSCNRLRGQIKDFVCLTLSHGTDCRINSWNGFSNTGWCLNKKISCFPDAVINTCYQFFLSFAVFKRKGQLLNRCRPFFTFAKDKIWPPFKAVDQRFKPFCQFFFWIFFCKTLYFFCFRIGIGHLYADTGKMVLYHINIAVHLCLRFMYRHRLF